ncbi:MAG: hypothetical protein HC877_23135 [Thioploca sp.]|nr:hypothetical protein [Thioploca sp.]
MKRMIVKTADDNGKLLAEYIVVKTGFQLFLEQAIKAGAVILSTIGFISILYMILG